MVDSSQQRDSNAPAGSRLVTLDQLKTLDSGSKVRFLGCVHSYDGDRAILLLRSHFPATSRDAPTALVRIENVLETMKHELLEVGSWLNVVGYVKPLPDDVTVNGQSFRKHERQTTSVEAALVWSAGAIKFEKYEEAVKAVQHTSSVILPP